MRWAEVDITPQRPGGVHQQEAQCRQVRQRLQGQQHRGRRRDRTKEESSPQAEARVTAGKPGCGGMTSSPDDAVAAPARGNVPMVPGAAATAIRIPAFLNSLPRWLLNFLRPPTFFALHLDDAQALQLPYVKAQLHLADGIALP